MGSPKKAGRKVDLVFHDLGAGAAPPAHAWVATFPGDMVSIHSITLPDAITGTERQKAAEGLLAERIVGNPDALEYRPLVTSPRDRAWSRMAVIDRDLVRDLQANCDARCLALVPDFLALPFADGVAVIDTAVSGQIHRLRIGPDFGCTAETPILMEVLRSMKGSGDIDGYFLTPGSDITLAAAVEDLGLSSVAVSSLSDPELSLIRRHDFGGHRRVGSDQSWPIVRANRMAIAAFYLAALVASVGMFLRADQIESAAFEKRGEINLLARQTFLPDGPILNVRQQVGRAIAAANASEGPLGAQRLTDGLAALSTVLPDKDYAIDRIGWGVGQGFVLELKTSSFAALQALSETLETVGFDVIVATSRVIDAGGVGATLRLETAEDPA